MKKKNMRLKSTYKKKESNNKFSKFIFKCFLIVLIFIGFSILIKSNPKLKNDIYNKVYNSNFSFAQFKNIYNKHIGNILPFQNIFKTKKVFNESLKYKSLSKYNKGVKLTLEDNYPIPSIKGGIVIFNGKKDGKKTLIIEQYDGIDVWYCNLSNTSLNLYDYVEDNSIVGEAKNNELYLMFYKDGVEIDYKEVLK